MSDNNIKVFFVTSMLNRPFCYSFCANKDGETSTNCCWRNAMIMSIMCSIHELFNRRCFVVSFGLFLVWTILVSEFSYIFFSIIFKILGLISIESSCLTANYSDHCLSSNTPKENCSRSNSNDKKMLFTSLEETENKIKRIQN